MAVLALSVGAWFALAGSPPDSLQGDLVRIMYIHVPSAVLGMALYAAMACAAFAFLIWKHPFFDLFITSSAPVGASFTVLCLVTGSIWGRPAWGAWWVWDARLTSVLILLLLYLGMIALRTAFRDQAQGARAAAVLLILGAVNLPIIKFSVTWWNTLHQPASLMRTGGTSIAPAMLGPLGVMFAGMILLAVWLVLMRMVACYSDR